jgi:putative peptidoglycan lipid II flippase
MSARAKSTGADERSREEHEPMSPTHPPQAPRRIPQGPAPRRRAGRPELTDAAVVSRSWGMALATLISRITGFIRIQMLAVLLGGALLSAFSVSNQLPNLIAALVLEATFTAIFVPVLARAERDDADGGTAFVRRLLTLSTTLLLVATLVSVVAAPLLVRLMLGGDPKVDRPLTTAFAYLLLPQIMFYGLSSVFMAILNTRNVFGPPAWAPVLNNVVAIGTLGVFVAVPGELSPDPVAMGTAKLLVLGIGTTLGVVAQTAVLFVAIRRERVSLRPLWGIDDRLKKFGGMGAAMLLYVLISQAGFVVGNQIASTAAASGPAVYNYAWLVLQLPFGMIGVTVLTVVMPRLSRNAAADDQPAVLADVNLATRLTMLTLIPVVAFMTVAGPAIGSALFDYGNFKGADAESMGQAIALSAFTLLPYAMVLLQARVFYAREQPWTPIVLVVVITAVKVIASFAAPHLTDDPELVAGYLGFANGLGFLAGAVVGHVVLRANLKPPGGRMISLEVVRTILVTLSGSLIAGLIAHLADRLLGLGALTDEHGGGGSIVRLLILGVLMLPIIATVLLTARVPDALAAANAIRRRLGRGGSETTTPPARVPVAPRPGTPLPYANQSSSPSLRPRQYGPPTEWTGEPPAGVVGGGLRRGSAVSDDPAGSSTPDAGSTTRIPRQSADDFQPDVPSESHLPPSGRPPADYGGDPTREPMSAGLPNEPAIEAATADDDVHLIPGATIAGGRYRLLVFHGGPPHLQFWHAMDTVLDRQVALTFVDPDAVLPDDELSEILTRTMKLGAVNVPGIARVLDVTRTGSGGLVVSEWIRGGSLAEVAETAPSAIGGARAVQSLAAAAEAAHRAGVALSIDHPGRVRVSIDGDVALAFPATLPSATPEDDIRGIGAALYALLVNRWPLPDAGTRGGMEPADLDAAGEPVEPTAVDRAIPFQISAAAVRAVQENGGIRSAPTLLNLLQQATAVADRTELIAPVDEREAAGARYRENVVDDPDAKARRKKGVLIGAAVAGAILVVALIVLATVLRGVFGDVGGSLDKDELGLNAPSSSTTSEPSSGTVKPVRATVFSPGGEADNPADAGNAIDGSTTTAWQTDTYSDAVPFPNFKSGVGLILQLPQPTAVASVSIDLNSTGTSIQLRSAQSATPASLDETTELTPPTPMKTGSNTITINNPQPVSNVLVWITTLGTVNGKSESALSNITLKSAS